MDLPRPPVGGHRDLAQRDSTSCRLPEQIVVDAAGKRLVQQVPAGEVVQREPLALPSSRIAELDHERDRVGARSVVRGFDRCLVATHCSILTV